MLSQSYKDIRRYLEAAGKLESEEEDYLKIKDRDVYIIPHKDNSLFSDQLPVNSAVLNELDEGNILYGISHADGEIYIQSFKKLKNFIGTEETNGNYLIPIENFINIKKLIQIKSKPIVHLHLHSENSILDAMGRIDDIARRCKQLNFPACGLTDHGNLAGTIDFYKACNKYKIKPIIGQEFYFSDDCKIKGVPEEIKKRFGRNKEGLKAYSKEHGYDIRYHHLNLFAKNEEGLRNIYKLSSLGFIDGYYYKPRIDWNHLKKYSKGIICSTACASGILWGKQDKKKRIVNLKKLVKIFGRENLYLEVFLIEFSQQPEMNDFIFSIQEKTGLNVFCSVDAHYVDPDPNLIHHKYTQMGAGYSVEGTGYYIKTRDELKELYERRYSDCKYKWDKYERALDLTLEFSKKCNIEMELGKFKMPKFDLSTAISKCLEGENALDYFKRRILDGFKRIIKKVDKKLIPDYKARLFYELKIFIEAGYIDYTLIVLDMIDYDKSLGNINTVRGSAAGSLLCYCLDMTHVDPIKNDLLFERFVSPLRAGLVDKSYQSPPDIDCDFQSRNDIIEYAEKKYGHECVARIGTTHKMQIKKAIKDMAKITEFMDFKTANKVTSKIPASCKSLEQAIDLSLDFGAWYNIKYNKKWVDTFVEPILGLSGQTSIHASGIVIAPGKLIDYLPIKIQQKKVEDEKSQNIERFTVTQFEGDSIEAIGLLKFDVLRVRTLAHLKKTRELIIRRHGVNIDFHNLDLDKKEYYKGFQLRDTQGIFQFDTKATANLLNHTVVKNFDDVTAVISLSRPGTAGPGLDMEYCDRKKGKAFEYDHPLLEPILKNTQGIILFQEQLMKTLNVIGNLSLIEADKFRKLIKKKDLQKIASYREKFIKGAIKNGFKNRNEAMLFWQKLLSWASYGFCKSHACAYAQLSVWTMILKQNFLLEFFIGWLETPKDKEQLIAIYKDIKRHEINIIYPNVNDSKTFYRINDKDEIVWSLKGIKYVGEKVAESISDNGPYKNMKEFVEKNKKSKMSKRSVDPLIFINAFPWCSSPQKAAEEYYAYRKENVPEQFKIDDAKYWNKMFHKYTGFFRFDPIDIYKKELRKFGKIDSYDDFKETPLGESVKLAGYVKDVKIINSKRGTMAIITIEVDLQEISIVLWPSFYKEQEGTSLTKNDLMDKFVFVFGDKDVDNRNNEQVQLGDIEDKFEVIE